MKKLGTLAVALSLLLSALSPLAAQQSQGQQPPNDDDEVVARITTNLVQLDAVVLDKDGRQVNDLTAEDFEVSEDGHPQKITNFSYVSNGERVPVTSKTKPVAGVPPTPPVKLRPRDVRRTFALVVDDLQLSFSSVYYLIGYRPSGDTFDRRFHSITVKVKRAGVSRKGFYGVTDEDRHPKPGTPGEQLLVALTSPFGASGVEVELTPLFTADVGASPFIRSLIHIKASDLTFNDDSDGWHQSIIDVFGEAFAPGEYVLQVIVYDQLRQDKYRLATQWIDFEVVK
jgi:hypothetical protein